MGVIQHYLIQMLPPACAGAVLWAVTYPRRRRGREAAGRTAGPYREGALFLFFMFLSGLLWLTLTPPDLEHFLATGRWLMPHSPFQREANLIPVVESWRLFQFYVERGMWSAILVNFPGNIIMFMPVGFFASLLSDKPRWWKGTLWAFGLSFFIETAQLFVARGTDVDDLILNTIGGLLGYGLFHLVNRIAPSMVAKCGNFQKGSVCDG